MSKNNKPKKLILKKFDMNMACQRYSKAHPDHPEEYGGRNIVFIGMRGIGKSVLVLDYLYHLSLHQTNIPIGTCVAPTDGFNKTYQPHIPNRFIFAEYTPDLVKAFVKRQRRIKRKVMNSDDPKVRRLDTRAFLIFDDMIHEVKDWANNQDIKYIVCNGRHIDVNFIITTQDPLGGGIPPMMRTNFNYTFICREPKSVNREKLHRHWCSIIANKADFESVLYQGTYDNKCLVVDNISIGDKIQDCLFIYKAKYPTPNFKLCCKEFWVDNELYAKYSDSDSEQEEYINNPKRMLIDVGISN